MAFRVYFTDLGWQDAREPRRFKVKNLPGFEFFTCRVERDGAKPLYRAQYQGIAVTQRGFETDREAARYVIKGLSEKSPEDVHRALARVKEEVPIDVEGSGLFSGATK